MYERAIFRTATMVQRLQQTDSGLALSLRGSGGEETLSVSHVYACAYSGLNPLLAASSLPLVPLKQETAELAVVELPEALRTLSVTGMCGPFFSVLPFPARPGLHTLSHVRYTPHLSWREGPDLPTASERPRQALTSAFPAMSRDAARYMPRLREAR